ncbi:MAG TPA: hypothetical protein VFX50_08705, partial [Gemmatimonadales bacterium]|nr:hypothetical protein [Gemmatimonadales bacterium]
MLLARSRRMALTALVAGVVTLSACGGDDPVAPVPFDPAGTSDDLSAIAGVYASPEFSSFAYAANQ